MSARLAVGPPRVAAAVLLCLCISSCTRTPASESVEAKSAAYLKEVFGIMEQQANRSEAALPEDELMNQIRSAEPERSRELIRSYADDVLDPLLADMEQTKVALTQVDPPPNMVSYHQSLVDGMTRVIRVSRDVNNAIRADDWDHLASKQEEWNAMSEQFGAQLESGLKAGGFSSAEDIDRALSTPPKPMAWYWALILMFVVTAFGIWVLSFVFGLASLLVMPLVALGIKWEEAGKIVMSRVTFVAALALVALGVSVVGSSIGAFAETFMFPRTELSPWFVYFVMGWIAVGFAAGDGRERDGCSMISSCSLSIACLIGYLWAVIAKGSLAGPWLWANQSVLNWLS